MSRRAGSPDQFRNFVERTSPAFLRVAYTLLGDRPSAEDATQVALLRTFHHWDRACQRPGGYMWQVLVNVCRDERRRRDRTRASDIASDNELPSQEDLDDGAAERLDLRQALRRLPYAQREVVVVRYYVGLSVSETATALGMHEGTVKSTTARALAHLKVHLSTRDLEVHDVE